MFHSIPDTILRRMRYLEKLDARHRREDVPASERLRQVPPATGKFLALTAAAAPEGRLLEIGTSGGYSTLWLSLACLALGRRLTTFEVLGTKVDLARETFKKAGVEDIIDLVVGDARQYLGGYDGVGFCFLDAEKVYYQECFDAVIPNLVPGGLLVADNIITHQQALGPFVKRAIKDERIDTLVVPIGSGLLLCRKTP